GAGEQGSRGAGEQGSRGAGEQGSRGAGEQGSRGAREQGRVQCALFFPLCPSAPLHFKLVRNAGIFPAKKLLNAVCKCCKKSKLIKAVLEARGFKPKFSINENCPLSH
ncbi:MAG: hypothetical protein V7L23_11775, partial [Nostoc sp.]|uniref:hypothetical protein n=1 Tax=Nostoc sp. TaxID=1180 RepID=UPI003B60D380